MGISFSSSLFGLAGSLILGFLDLQSSQAQNRFYTDLEDWLASTVREYGDGGSGLGGELQHAMERMRAAVEEGGGSRSTTAAMANLAEAIQGLVAHMRTEQQMIREWADGQGEQNREIKKLLERIAREERSSREELAVESFDMLDHVTIGVSDIERSRSFYDLALRPLGSRDSMRKAKPLGLWRCSQGILLDQSAKRATDGRPYRLHDAGPAIVDRFHAEAIAAGGRDNGPPEYARITIPVTMEPLSSIPTATISRQSATRDRVAAANASTQEIENSNGPRPCTPQRIRFQLLAGFVDALSTLVLSIVFLLSVFLVVQFFLSQEVTGKDKALEQLNAKIAQLNDLLSLEKLGKIALDDQIGQLRAGLAAAEGERDRIKGLYDGLAGAGDAQGRANELNKALESEKTVSSRALAQIEVLNQQISALRRQLAALEEALEASEKRDKESQGRIADLGQRLNVALAQRVQELSRYRSEFFGRLRAILGNRPDIRIVGDRFVFQSEVFFDSGQALLLPEAAPNSTSSPRR
jgi:predicted  nucleic acid-binding Zn-ribbon protein